jgi:AIPR protein
LDRITSALLDSYIEKEQLHSLPRESAFERFAAYSILASKIFDSFPSDDVAVGDGSTPGIDSLAIVVNGTLVPTVDDLESLTQASGHLEAEYYFIQSKTSPSFNGAYMTDFTEQVHSFFTKDIIPEALRENKAVSERLLALGARLRRNPNCNLYYVTTGRWVGDSHLEGRVESAKERIQDLAIFEEVRFSPLGADHLQRLYRATQNRVSVNFSFRDKTTLPIIAGVDQAYLGYLPAEEFLKIIQDENGDLRRGIFEDNVRDFQGWNNEVNQSIVASVGSEQDRFVVLNNGVTIVARSLTTRANEFLLEDFQVVNGCQTSNVLYDQRANLRDLTVPVRIVATQSDDIANAITAATNSQSKVTKEDLYALLSFQRKLEDFFATFDGRERLFYERRSRQYEANDAVTRNKVISRSQLVKSFASVFLNEPHRASRYYSTLYRQVGDLMFSDDHALETYYVSAVSLYRLESFFRTQNLYSSVRPARYHVLHALRHLAVGDHLPQLNSKAAAQLARGLADVLWDEPIALELYRLAGDVVLKASGDAELTRDFTKQPSFTKSVTALALSRRHQIAAAPWKLAVA